MKAPRQVFYYFGAKAKISTKYPKPLFDTIIEPFAGSAAYSQLYWEKDVYLLDAYDVIVELWGFLIGATAQDILDLPDIVQGTNIRDLDIPDGAKHLIAFHANQGTARPARTPNKRAIEKNWWNSSKKEISELVHRFSHWKIMQGNYATLPNAEVTWFIDPPYEQGGKNYVHNNIDYAHLSDWCKSRRGQAIVCENEHGSWLPFKPLVPIHGMRKPTTEHMWTNV